MRDSARRRTPRTSSDLEVGDFWAIPLPSGRFGVAQVVELARSGPGARSTLMVGVVDWVGDVPPSANEFVGRRVVDVGLTNIQIFAETKAEILGNAPVDASADEFDSHYRDFHLGARHSVWGWKTVARRVAAAVDA